MVYILLVVGISFLIFIHELGHFLAAKRFGLLVEEFGFGFPPRLFSKKVGETVYSLNAIPFGGFVKIYGEQADLESKEAVKPELRKRSFIHQSVSKRSLIIVAGVIMNFLIGWIIISSIDQQVLIQGVMPGSPAAAVGFLKGDRVLGFETTEQFRQFIDAHKGTEISLDILRNGSKVSVAVTPRLNPPKGQGSLGVSYSPLGVVVFPTLSQFGKGFTTSFAIMGEILKSLGRLVIGQGLNEVVGPVGIFKVAGEQAKAFGLSSIFQLIGLISLNLTVLNILPFPALDGGRFLFLLIEKVKGSPLNAKREALINAAGFIILLILMVLITARDVYRIF